mmetsp:Transcript_60771/g.188429  ORF Transcript_60771/g.188429 Transcript_60771/m.188429 type:complete len:103 (+) Transcript_60771:80-388(+)|eukprot:CAMPEP_0175509654 /NCGR_PEP_ID=MMETSP0096-20121207/10993_1 /TAXON_ID=311494 /ORGANISM="Alexandrium monilatum, Strain CCMP3105" /LENGTH=102 /DNA_ID=CAMNT_0016811823 /DNA_START=51 /DNA_END=359 /DNA_ORIENTATION=+
MARRSSSGLVAVVICAAALWALASFAAPAFVPAASVAPRSQGPPRLDPAVQAAAVGAVLAAPGMAHAATSSYALLQLGWAVFIVGLGPAVLFFIYFTKPELL